MSWRIGGLLKGWVSMVEEVGVAPTSEGGDSVTGDTVTPTFVESNFPPLNLLSYSFMSV